MAEFIPTDFKSIGELAWGGISSAVVAIGVFDGVHLGHRKVLTELLTVAHDLKAAPVVMTFFPHPRSLLTKEPPRLLYPPEEKVRLLYRAGAQAVVTVNFTPEFANLTPTRFLDCSVFAGPVPVLGICVGKHWRFGAKAAGDAAFLEKMSVKRFFRFSAVDELCRADGLVVSSTAIREAVAAGRLDDAEKMLGRRYSLFGTVGRGYRVAGAELSAPTANVKITDGVLPPYGVYAARVRVNHAPEVFPAAVNIGVAPTFRKRYGRIDPRIEVHLLNGFEGNLYGQSLELELAGFIRTEQPFDSVEALKEQIARDITQIQSLLERS